MKRELTKDEKELTELGLNRNLKDLEDINEAINITKKHIAFLKLKRQYEDEARPFNRASEDRELERTLKGYEAELEFMKEKIKVAKEHLSEGVESK